VRHRSRAVRAGLIALAALPLCGAGEPGGEVSITVTGLRNTRGLVLACLTAQPRAFPNCSKDPAARSAIVPASATVRIDFGPVPPGRYAIALIHDENANHKLDMALIVPREGYGFSRDAPVMMGPPKFAAAAFDVAGAPLSLSARMRYLL
jgi:uncharacterized protein (DUF2141 family)